MELALIDLETLNADPREAALQWQDARSFKAKLRGEGQPGERETEGERETYAEGYEAGWEAAIDAVANLLKG